MRFARRFPAVTVVITPYAILVIPIAIFNGSQHVSYVLGLLALAVAGCLVSELFFPPIRNWSRWRMKVAASCSLGRPLWRLTLVVIGISSVARITYFLTGSGSVEAYVKGTGGGTVAALATLFSSWPYLAAGLIFACFLGQVAKKSRILLAFAVLFSVELVASVLSQKVSVFVYFATPVAILSLILGLLKLRVLVLSYLGVLLIWPTWFAFRNLSRMNSGVRVNNTVDSFERLRFDEQMSIPAWFDVPVDLGQSGIPEILRYGLIPRVIDPGRPPLETGQLINIALGGAGNSSYNFLSIGTIYFFYGSIGLVTVFAATATVYSIFWRWAESSGPIAICAVVVTTCIPLGWTATFPDAIASYLQAFVAAIPIGFLLVKMRKADRRLSRSKEAETLRPGCLPAS